MNKSLIIVSALLLGSSTAVLSKTDVPVQQQNYVEGLTNCRRTLEGNVYSSYVRTQELIIRILSIISDINSFGVTKETEEAVAQFYKDFNNFLTFVASEETYKEERAKQREEEEERQKRREDAERREYLMKKQTEEAKAKMAETQALQEIVNSTDYSSPGYVTNQQANALHKTDPIRYNKVVETKTKAFLNKVDADIKLDNAFAGY
jgi:hypothetical protein